MNAGKLIFESDQQKESLWKQYLLWQSIYNSLCAAYQFVSKEKFMEYIADDAVTKISMIDEGTGGMIGFMFVTKECEKTEFFNPLYFEAHPLENTGFVPRGCVCVNPERWSDKIDKNVLFNQILQLSQVDKLIIDYGDVKGPYELLPEGSLIDKMTGIGWNLQDCNYKMPSETPKIRFLHNFHGVSEVDMQRSWALFIKGFDNIQDSICPPLFDEEYYAELYNDLDIVKSFVEVDGQIVGGMIILPIEKIPFIERDKLDFKIGYHENIYFILTMTVLKDFRSIKIFKYLSIKSMDIFFRKSFISMDHSQNINPGFLSAIKRTLVLQNENIQILGCQNYKIINKSA